MNTARLDLCKQLYELSRWDDINHVVYRMKKGKPIATNAFDTRSVGIIPVYDLGYLLQKLPQNSWVGYVDTSGRRGYALAKTYAWNEKGTDIDKIAECRADTPENAAVMLAIELFKRGILKREVSSNERRAASHYHDYL